MANLALFVGRSWMLGYAITWAHMKRGRTLLYIETPRVVKKKIVNRGFRGLLGTWWRRIKNVG